MKKIFIILLLSFVITGCQWQDERVIKEVVTNHYSQPLCIDLGDISDKQPLIDSGLLMETTVKTPSDIMGYSLETKYVPTQKARSYQNDGGSLCYGVYKVKEFKNITFEDSTHAIVSFVTYGVDIADWAQNLGIQQGQQLLRVHVEKTATAIWEIVDR